MQTCAMMCATLLLAATGSARHVTIVTPQLPPGPARYGLSQLTYALEQRGVRTTPVSALQQAAGDDVILAGLASQPDIAQFIQRKNLSVPTRAEALAICRVKSRDRRIIVVCGSDPVGLMYAALDTAQRVRWTNSKQDPFHYVRDTSESPCLTDRSVSTYTMQRRLFEQRLYDARYWQRYFDLLASSRINSYVIIFGYENGGFMAPPYPYFFNVEGFDGVRLFGITESQQAQNTAALRRVIELAHQRGIRITLGIWDHIYRGGVQAGGIAGASDLAGKPAPHLVYGLSKNNLAAYTKAALGKLLRVFPHIDAIQFRMHWESGLTRKETPGFWHDVLSMLRRRQPDIKLDLRAKGLPDEVIDDAVEQGLPFRITTKYWMEQMGMPFHPTHINRQNQKDRRHGYADLLRYPQRYDMHWRIWTGGTARILLWGDPDYVRRFVESAKIYRGKSFEVNEMLATKMLGADHDAVPAPLLTPAYRYYDYEFERYWHYYQVWGRIAYNPAAPPELWEHEFTRRFGHESGQQVMKALHLASRVLPRIVAASYNYRYFPTTRGWAEMMRFGDLPEYAKGTGTDIEQFQSYADAARQLLAGETTTKRTPLQTSRWFADTSAQILDLANAASDAWKAEAGAKEREFQVTITDLRMLAYLASFHARRMRAAVWFNVYLQTKDQFALEQSMVLEHEAIDQWQAVVCAAGDVYAETLQFGVHRVGFSHHWKEELAKLEAGFSKLGTRAGRATLTTEQRTQLVQRFAAAAQPPALQVTVARTTTAAPGKDLSVSAVVTAPGKIGQVRLRYRHLTQFEDYATSVMQRDPTSGKYVGVIPGSFIDPHWDVMYFVEAEPESGNGVNAPDLESGLPYVVVRVGSKTAGPAGSSRLAPRVRHLPRRGLYRGEAVTRSEPTDDTMQPVFSAYPRVKPLVVFSQCRIFLP